MTYKREACPGCKAIGRDKTNNHLVIGHNGDKWCKSPSGFSCGYREGKGSPMQEQNKNVPLAAISKLPFADLTFRGIREEISELYGSRAGYNQEYRTVEDIYHPYYKDGKIAGYKHRQVENKKFSYIGDAKEVELFGQHLCTGTKRLLIVGGEEDAQAAYQILWDYTEKKYPGKGYSPDVVSLPKGESVVGIADNFEFIDRYESVILCADMDEVGRKAVHDIAAELSRENVKIMEISEKDANKMLEKGKQAEFINAFFEAVEWKPEGFVEITLEDIMTPKEQGFSYPFPDLENKLHGLRKGEITLITAGSGVGKSTIVRAIALHLMREHNLKVGNMYLEESQVDTAQTYIAMMNELHPMRFAINPKQLGNDKLIQNVEFLNKNGVFYKHFGSLEDDELVAKLRYMVKVKHCDFIILDHISMVVSGRAASRAGERKDIDVLMTNLASFVVDNNVGLVVVSHLSRNKEKNWNRGAVPDLMDLRGSAALEQLSWVIIAASRDQHGDVPNLINLHALKNRPWGFLGNSGSCQYQPETGLLENISTDYLNDEE